MAVRNTFPAATRTTIFVWWTLSNSTKIWATKQKVRARENPTLKAKLAMTSTAILASGCTCKESLIAQETGNEEVVTDPETGNVVHRSEEPLSEHRGHGSARSTLE
jgi:hypothetical protein